MYDYVIIGAGSAGCVLAHRLTEDPTISELLLESGGADTACEVHIPAAFSRLYQSAYDCQTRGGPCLMRVRTTSLLAADHLDSIHQVAPASAYARTIAAACS
jgi:choline dehydrogenase-like flavoprotein